MRTLRSRWWLVWGWLLSLGLVGGAYAVAEEFVGKTVAVFLTFVFSLHLVGWFLSRSVVRPLDALSAAAHRVAQGELDFHIPESSVREVAAVRSAFQLMAQNLKSSLEREQKLEAERRFLLGAIAHDLRTPLFALRGYLEGLETGVADSDEKRTKYLAVCREKADQLERLVSDLFALTKLDVLEKLVSRESVDWADLVERSVEGFQPQATQKGVTIRIYGADQQTDVLGDGHLLQRALENLLDNAIRHSPAGGLVEVRWKVTSADGIEFCILDEGAGIAEWDISRIFEPMYRSESSRNRETGGAGLGLSIARRVMRLHGGELVAENREQGGACLKGWLE
ncbi:hypothetical protein CIG75_00425 [Tumebacillus algifaecis]|uniref:histidine kinase n=1 Tax=Tumebacillus algifaecis TaxID=1214604 RepID=A0A223CW82_9BACL|nr:HAMP domain-containing sensor histidine kinase [Tumebacillus algifaecis]ASS73589.1 hypothetical protein CIG75_00425 [Tumebacillus algifaecis]